MAVPGEPPLRAVGMILGLIMRVLVTVVFVVMT